MLQGVVVFRQMIEILQFQGGLLQAPLNPLRTDVSRGPPGLSGGPGPLGPHRNSTTGPILSWMSLSLLKWRFINDDDDDDDDDAKQLCIAVLDNKSSRSIVSPCYHRLLRQKAAKSYKWNI